MATPVDNGTAPRYWGEAMNLHTKTSSCEGKCEEFVLASDYDALAWQLKIQKAVADLAYIPHQHLVERNERLQQSLTALQSRVTHCDPCGASWYDDGNNGTGCPYCALTARDDRISELERRMTDARRILTNGNPTPDCNWGILDVTRDLKP